MLTVNFTSGYCNEDHGYSDIDLMNKSRCLPDTANPRYQWGFSTMLSGVWIILQLVWVLTMYTVWQDAQFNSTLVKSGYEMTQLRAVFTLATAARQKTGMRNKELVRADTKSLESELFGSRKKEKEKAEVDYEIFREKAKGEIEDEEFELRKRGDRVREDEI